jgi:hypothetical protein
MQNSSESGAVDPRHLPLNRVAARRPARSGRNRKLTLDGSDIVHLLGIRDGTSAVRVRPRHKR